MLGGNINKLQPFPLIKFPIHNLMLSSHRQEQPDNWARRRIPMFWSPKERETRVGNILGTKWRSLFNVGYILLNRKLIRLKAVEIHNIIQCQWRWM